MFEDSLVESLRKRNHRAPWTTTLSFTVQAVIVGLLVLLPLLLTQALPKHQLILLQPPQPPAARAAGPARVDRRRTQAAELDHGVLRFPSKIPNIIATLREESSSSVAPLGVAGDIPGGVPNGALFGISGVASTQAAPLPKLALPSKLRVSSGVAEGMLLHKVMPQYPALARQARIQGAVVLQAVIDKAGSVKDLRVVSGHPMLIPAAMEAVKQWRYRPYYLNREPVEVETLITVNFTLAEN